MYVAFTRAEEKLILVSGGKNYSDKTFTEKTLYCENGHVYPIKTIDTTNTEDLLLYCLTCHPACVPLLSAYSDVMTGNREDIDVFVEETVPDEEEVNRTGTVFEIPLSKEELERRCAPAVKVPKIPAKLSVTELVKNRLADSESEQLIKESAKKFETGLRRPDFMSRTDGLSGAEAGTAMHTFVSLADLSLPVEEETSRLIAEKFISEKQAEVILRSKPDIAYFTDSDLYRKMMSAKNIRKEEYFISRLPAREFLPGAGTEDGNIVLQGAIDVLCEYDDHIMIIDYKTDRAVEKELLRRYSKQLEYYAYAAQKAFKKPVTELYIWSFYMSRAIKIEPNGGTENDKAGKNICNEF